MKNLGYVKTIVVAGIAGALLAAPAISQAVQFDPNPWRGFGFLNMAHQGGEDEAPSNTLFAFKTAISERGADTLELDVNLTSDNRLVVIHDDTVNKTTERTGSRAAGNTRVVDLTLAEVQALDGAYSFKPGGIYDDGTPDSDYPYRGMAQGTVPPPEGFTADDFQHPTIEQVLDAFPNTPINIELKIIKTAPGTGHSGTGCAEGNAATGWCDNPSASLGVSDALAGVLNSAPYASRRDIMVVSFSQDMVNRFNLLAPQVAIAPALTGVATALVGATPNPDVSAFQIPPRFTGFPMLPESMLQPPASAHDRGYAVHVFTENAEDESPVGFQRFVNAGVEGVMVSAPGRLHDFLCTAGVRRPDGSARCPAQDLQAPPATPPPSDTAKKKCKKGKKGKKLKKGKKKGKKGKCVKKKKGKKGKKGKRKGKR